jgi:ketosteroid isomerase-like protein
MKTKFLLLSCALILGLFSCTAPQETKLTEADKAEIEKEITTIIDSIATSASELRTDYFKKVYWNNDQFIGVDLTGAKGYDAYMAETDMMYAEMKNISFMENKVSVVVFDDKTAVALFEGNAKGENKAGIKMNMNNFNASMVFRNIEGQWKVVYTHESADEEIVMTIDSIEMKEEM